MQGHTGGGYRQGGCLGNLETGDAGARQGGAETEPAMRQGLRIEVVDDTLTIDKETGTAQQTLDLHVIPVVGLQQMGLVGVFLQDGGTLGRILDACLITIIAAEARGRIVVAPKTEVVHLQGVAAGEDTTAPGGPREDILRLRVARQPEAVQVAQPVARLALIHHTGIVLHRHAGTQRLFAPQRESFGREQFAGVAPEGDLVVGRLRFYLPVSGELSFVETRLAGSCIGCQW